MFTIHATPNAEEMFHFSIDGRSFSDLPKRHNNESRLSGKDQSAPDKRIGVGGTDNFSEDSSSDHIESIVGSDDRDDSFIQVGSKSTSRTSTPTRSGWSSLMNLMKPSDESANVQLEAASPNISRASTPRKGSWLSLMKDPPEETGSQKALPANESAKSIRTGSPAASRASTPTRGGWLNLVKSPPDETIGTLEPTYIDEIVHDGSPTISRASTSMKGSWSSFNFMKDSADNTVSSKQAITKSFDDSENVQIASASPASSKTSTPRNGS